MRYELNEEYREDAERWFDSDEDPIPHEHDYTSLKKKVHTIKCPWCKRLKYPRKFRMFGIKLRHKTARKYACTQCIESKLFHERIDKIEEEHKLYTFRERKERRRQS